MFIPVFIIFSVLCGLLFSISMEKQNTNPWIYKLHMIASLCFRNQLTIFSLLFIIDSDSKWEKIRSLWKRFLFLVFILKKGGVYMNKVLISADSTCDIGPELQKKFNIRLLNWRIELDGQEYIDNQEITPDDLYRAWREKGILPKSLRRHPSGICESFWSFDSTRIWSVHIGLGSGISSAFRIVLLLLRGWEGSIRWILKTCPAVLGCW